MEIKDHNDMEQLNAASYFLDHNILEGRRTRIAVYYRNGGFTYNDIFILTNRVGNVLKELGVEVENRIYLVLNDSPESVACYYAAMKIGAIPAFGYTFLSPKEYLQELNNIKPKVVVADSVYIDRLREAIKDSKYPKNLLVLGEGILQLRKGEVEFHRMVECADEHLEPEATYKDDIGIYAFSGGTTGVRKIIPHSHYNMVVAYEAYQQIIHYVENDVILPVPKLFYGYARTSSILMPFRAGAAAVVFPERTTPEMIFKLVEKYRPSILINVPTMMRAMLQTPKEKRTDLSCIRVCTSAGEALSAELYNEWMRNFGCEVLDCIGSGEMFYLFASNTVGNARPGSVGKPLPGVEAKIVDDTGRELPEGEVGALAIKSGTIGTHYLRNYEKSKKTFRGEWVYSDDLFSKDKDGYLYFLGRRDDLLKVSGYFVSPLEIEECINTYPDVAECAVVGVKDKDGLLKTKAFIVLRKGIVESESMGDRISEYVRNKLSPYKYPRLIQFVGKLPLTNAGKIDRRKLRE
jgi:benzoate-CoA ligase family protein